MTTKKTFYPSHTYHIEARLGNKLAFIYVCNGFTHYSLTNDFTKREIFFNKEEAEEILLQFKAHAASNYDLSLIETPGLGVELDMD